MVVMQLGHSSLCIVFFLDIELKTVEAYCRYDLILKGHQVYTYS